MSQSSSSSPCPPTNASPTDGAYFRCCRQAEPHGDDFLNAVEQGTFRRSDQCRRMSLSVFRSLEDAMHHARLYPRRKWAYVRVAKLGPEHGHDLLTTGTMPTHSSWWPPVEMTPSDRSRPFAVVVEVARE